MPDPPDAIPLDPDVPVTLTVDFQSLHHAAFRLFTFTGPNGKAELLKEGSADTTFSVAPDRLKKGLLYEFLFFKEKAQFRAALVFTQKDVTNLVTVKAKGGDMLARGEVEFT